MSIQSNAPKDNHDEFTLFANFLQQACGIALTPNKQYLVSTRIKRILADNNIPSLTALVQILKSGNQAKLRDEIVDAMTTNETYWFRDSYPFDYLKSTVFPALFPSGSGDIRIWSAACSTGQEPYSLSMTVEEFLQTWYGQKRNVRIVATDISSRVLAQSKLGVYDKLAMTRGLTTARAEKFFVAGAGETKGVKPDLKARIEFRVLNLLDNYHAMGKFDIIFCRNVLIYFSGDLKREILLKLHGCLKPNGLLCLGSSEGLSGLTEHYQMLQCSPGIMYRAL